MLSRFPIDLSSRAFILRKLRLALFAVSGLIVSSIGLSGCFGAISGCLSMAANGQQQASTLAGEMHQKMTQGDLAGIYDGADQRYRDVVTREKSDALFSSIARKLGSPQDCKNQAFNVNVTTNGTFLRSVCQTSFSKDATGTETFVWVKSGDQFKLVGYHINSEELIER